MSDAHDEKFKLLLAQFEKIVQDTDARVDYDDDIQKKYLLHTVPEMCRLARTRGFDNDFNAASLLMMSAGYVLFDLVSRAGPPAQKRNFTDDQITQMLLTLSFADLEHLFSSVGILYWYYSTTRRQ